MRFMISQWRRPLPKARKTPAGAPPTQRQLRVGELVRHALSDLLLRGDIHDPALTGSPITVPEVRCSPDLRNATVYVMPLGGRDTDAVLRALDRNGKFIRGVIARNVNLKYAPQLSFKIDTSFDEADKVGRLLNNPKVRRDLVRDTSGSDGGETVSDTKTGTD